MKDCGRDSVSADNWLAKASTAVNDDRTFLTHRPPSHCSAIFEIEYSEKVVLHDTRKIELVFDEVEDRFCSNSGQNRMAVRIKSPSREWMLCFHQSRGFFMRIAKCFPRYSDLQEGVDVANFDEVLETKDDCFIFASTQFALKYRW